MFDLLKKKFSSFIGSITKKEKEESNSGEETGINQAEEQHSKTAIEIVNRGTGENQHHNKIELSVPPISLELVKLNFPMSPHYSKHRYSPGLL